MKNEEITRTRENGTETLNSSQFDDPGTARIDACRRIVERCQYGKIDGVMVDLFTASCIVKVYDALNPGNQKKMRSLPICGMADISLRLLSK